MRIATCLSILALIAAVFPPASLAGKNSNGALIVHVNDEAVYTQSVDYCDGQWTPTSCVDAVTQSNAPQDEEIVIWVIAGFPGGSSPAVTGIQFGIEHTLPPGQGYVPHWGPCGPSPLVLPDPGFPDAPGGTLIGYGQPVFDLFFSIAWFGVYWNVPGDSFRSSVYPAIAQALFADDSVPPVIDEIHAFGEVRWQQPGGNDCVPPPGPGACCLPDGSCVFVHAEDCSGDFMGEYVPCEAVQCPQPPQACCMPDGSCHMLPPEVCDSQGGLPMGEGTDCEGNPCMDIPGACCLPTNVCEVLYVWDCPGTFLGEGTTCDSNPCPQACCFENGSCEEMTDEDCRAQGGEPMGEGTQCERIECIPVATESTTWGQIKANYR